MAVGWCSDDGQTNRTSLRHHIALLGVGARSLRSALLQVLCATKKQRSSVFLWHMRVVLRRLNIQTNQDPFVSSRKQSGAFFSRTQDFAVLTATFSACSRMLYTSPWTLEPTTGG